MIGLPNCRSLVAMGFTKTEAIYSIYIWRLVLYPIHLEHRVIFFISNWPHLISSWNTQRVFLQCNTHVVTGMGDLSSFTHVPGGQLLSILMYTQIYYAAKQAIYYICHGTFCQCGSERKFLSGLVFPCGPITDKWRKWNYVYQQTPGNSISTQKCLFSENNLWTLLGSSVTRTWIVVGLIFRPGSVFGM